MDIKKLGFLLIFPFSLQDPNNPLILRSVWEELLTGKDAPIFFNPLYNPVTSTISPSSINFLRVRPSLPNLQIWQQCYFRHIPLLEIRGGGNPQVKNKN